MKEKNIVIEDKWREVARKMFNYSYKGPFQKEANLLNPLHFDLKGSRSQAKINENFANYFLKTKANYKCFIVLKCAC